MTSNDVMKSRFTEITGVDDVMKMSADMTLVWLAFKRAGQAGAEILLIRRGDADGKVYFDVGF